ncbi:MAG: 2-dehydropantoate 2-reductase, partial [Proteobacteria bacterium]|nr:2-dehydropantoate 2-reductase [Pseudomonadota bacterium]
MNILVVGLGAIGTVFSVFLKSSGHNVYGLTKRKYLEELEKELSVTGIFGERKAMLDKVSDDPDNLKDIPFDLIIITVKSFDTEKAVNDIKGLVSEKTLVLSAQNGYGNYETAGNILGFHRVILGRVIFGSRLIKTGFAEVTVIADAVRIGNPHQLINEKIIKDIAETIDKSGIPTKYADDVYEILWDKILYNSALNPLGAILRCNYGQLAENENTRTIMNKIIEE